MLYVIAYDIGTTGLKTCLFSIGETIEMIAGTYSDYDLYILENGACRTGCRTSGGRRTCSTTKEIMSETDVTPDMIDGISFCSQMQGMVLVDREGRALRRPMSYMDQRAVREMKECQSHGIRIAGVNVFKLPEESEDHARGVDERKRSGVEVQVGPQRTSRRSLQKRTSGLMSKSI